MAANHAEFVASTARACGNQRSCSGRAARTSAAPRTVGASDRLPALNGEHASFRQSVATAQRLTLFDRPATGPSQIWPMADSPTGALTRLSQSVRAALSPILERNGIGIDTEDIDAVLSSPVLLAELGDALSGVVADLTRREKSSVGIDDLLSARPAGSVGGGTACSSGGTARPRERGALGASRSSQNLMAAGAFLGSTSGAAPSASGAPGAPDTSAYGGAFPNWDWIDLPRFGGGPGGGGGLCPPAADESELANWSCDAAVVPLILNCSHDDAEDICNAADYLAAHLDKIKNPSGEDIDYAALIPTWGAGVDARCIHTADDDPHGGVGLENGAFAMAFSDTPMELSVLPPFFETGAAADLIGVKQFRAGILLHEMIHAVDYGFELLLRVFGATITFPERAAACGVSETSDCDFEPSHEWRAAYVQGRFYGLDDCASQVFACSYVRQVCSPASSKNANIWKAASDMAICYLGYTSVVVVGILGAVIMAGSFLLAGFWAEALGVLIGSSAATTLVALLFLILILETPLG